MMRWVALLTRLALAALALQAAASPALAGKRIALVVGNNAYQHLTPLRKAVNDARAVKGALEELGFTVIDGENLSRRDMNRRLTDLERSIEPGDTVFLFYAGHGVAIGAENYLLPIDMPLPQGGEDSLVRNEGHAADAIIRAIQSKGAATTFVVLDACRNNPIADRGTRNIGLDRGLARMDAPAGVFVLFSAGLGQTALDRLSEGESEPNSVFTRKLVPLLKTPGLSHVDLAKELQQQVSQLAATIKHRQEPAYYDQIIGRIVLKEGTAAATPANSADTAELARLKAEIEALKRRQSEQQANLAPPPKPETAVRPEPAAPAPAKPEAPAASTDMKPGTTFRDCPECPEMVVVPAGSFTMGSPEGEEGRNPSEGPLRKVTIAKPFAVGKLEVTFAEWDACVAAGGCKTKPDDEKWGRGKRPVINVSWDDSKQFAAWLTKKTGNSYRLLTEAEWEYAARAGTTTAFSTGKTITTDEANFDGTRTYGGSAKGIYRGKTVEVGSFKPNAFGLHDMHGNVWEWVEDCDKESYKGAPSDGAASTSGDCSLRICRGASFGNVADALRSAVRIGMPTDGRSELGGLRVARSLD